MQKRLLTEVPTPHAPASILLPPAAQLRSDSARNRGKGHQAQAPGMFDRLLLWWLCRHICKSVTRTVHQCMRDVHPKHRAAAIAIAAPADARQAG